MTVRIRTEVGRIKTDLTFMRTKVKVRVLTGVTALKT